MNELVFEVMQEEDGGFCAECLSENIFTQGDTWEAMRQNVQEAVRAYYFDQAKVPRPIRLHLVRDELLARRMKVPRDLSGAQLIKVLCRDWGYHQAHQEGSHVILETETPGHQRLSVPNHYPLRVGTLNAIVRAVATHKNADRQTILDSLR